MIVKLIQKNSLIFILTEHKEINTLCLYVLSPEVVYPVMEIKSELTRLKQFETKLR